MIDNRLMRRAQIGALVEILAILGLLLITVLVLEQSGPAAAETLQEFGRILGDGLACADGGCL